MTRINNVFLIGPMGAGKTTIGRMLAKNLAFEFVDSDQVIEQRTGVNIPLIFELEGESGFRNRECEVLEELSQMQGVVLATGGGAVLDAGNRRCLQERGTVVYLYAPLAQLIERTQKDRNRPLLQTQNPQLALEELVRVRGPLYRELANIECDTHGVAIRPMVDRLLKQIKAQWGAQ